MFGVELFILMMKGMNRVHACDVGWSGKGGEGGVSRPMTSRARL